MPSVRLGVVEPPHHDLKKMETVVVNTVSPSPSASDDNDLPKLERMPHTSRANGLLNGSRTPDSIDFVDADDPVVIVGMGM